jgi:hypothetical protein
MVNTKGDGEASAKWAGELSLAHNQANTKNGNDSAV